MSASVLPQIMMVVKQPSDGRTEAEQRNQRSARKQGVDISFFLSFFFLFFSNSCQIMRGAAPAFSWEGESALCIFREQRERKCSCSLDLTPPQICRTRADKERARLGVWKTRDINRWYRRRRAESKDAAIKIDWKIVRFQKFLPRREKKMGSASAEPTLSGYLARSATEQRS